MTHHSSFLTRGSASVCGLALLLTACATSTPAPTARVDIQAKEEIVAVSVSNHVLRFNAGQPQNVRERRLLQGLRDGERLLGIDFRVAKGELFALGSSGQLYKIDVAQALAVAVGVPVALPADGKEYGVDFNPTVDRIRVVNDAGFNLRLHPDTGALVDANPNEPGVQLDGRLAYDAVDSHAGKTPAVVAAGYTYNKTNDKITTNYALDGAAGVLVHQGTKEGVTPAVSPNTGRLYTVGSLGIGRFDHATLDISDLSNTAYTGVHNAGAAVTRWYRLDLATGKASFVGNVGGGEALVGAAIEP
ncbi:MAG: DUF4394 domain-containing protein [Chitinophagaceae bacterium]|nr:DUF4394 domain-containing protein [Rubrivivax sp.]